MKGILIFLGICCCTGMNQIYAQSQPGTNGMPAPKETPYLYGKKMSDGMVFTRDMVAAPSYTELKYSICFANQVQMAYNGMKLKQYINESILETGDLSFYTGHYGNAAGRYMFSLQYLQDADNRRTSFSLYAIAMKSFDSSKLNDKDMRIYTSAITSVGILYQARGKFNYAENLLQRAMNWRAARFGKTSKEYINSLHNMAVLKKDLGQFDESERMFNYLVPTFKKVFTEESLQYVVVMNNKAMLLAELGRTKEARQLLDEALRIGKTVLDRSYMDYERILTNRALIEQESGSAESADTYFKEAIANTEKNNLDDHPDYNNMLLYYGSLKIRRKDPNVLDFLQEVTRKARKRYGDNHPLVASAFANLGDFYFGKGDFKQADEEYENAVSIIKKSLGNRNRVYLNTLIKRANCSWQLKKNDMAKSQFSEAVGQYLYLVRTFFPSMSEAEKASFFGSFKPGIDSYLSFASETGDGNPEWLKDMYNLQLETKGILFNATRQTRNSILNSGDEQTKDLYLRWLNQKNIILSYYSSPVEDQDEDKVDLAKMEQDANAMEKELSKRSSRFSETYSGKGVLYDDVRGSLKPGEAAMEIIRVSNPLGNPEKKVTYIALIARKDYSYPVMARLTNGRDLEEKAIRVYRSSIKYSKDNNATDDKAYRAFWETFDKALGNCSKLYLSVDGVYNNVSLNTLSRPDGKYLIDAYPVVQVSNTKYLAGAHAASGQVSVTGSQPLLVGFPDFGNEATVPPLPATQKEIQQIQSLLSNAKFNPLVYTGAEANSANIEAAPHPGFLHIATHGFFSPSVNSGDAMSMGIQVSKAKENPLLRSGLLLAGAASVISNEPTLGGKSNGILYAYHVMNMDLSNTKLVVLSACETGLGEVVNGEGVYGLCRAFQVAGAGKVIMSLWKVDDAATQELMSAFYQGWLQSGDAQQAFMDAEQQIRKKYPKPYYWGAFVLVN